MGCRVLLCGGCSGQPFETPCIEMLLPSGRYCIFLLLNKLEKICRFCYSDGFGNPFKNPYTCIPCLDLPKK